MKEELNARQHEQEGKCACVFEHSIVFMDKRLLGTTEKYYSKCS